MTVPAVSVRHWSAAYLGLPGREVGATGDGVTCWGIVRRVYAEELGLALPCYEGTPDAEEVAEIEGALAGQAGSWIEVPAGEEREYDLVTFSLGGVESHIGIVTWSGAFLHVVEGIHSRVERYTAEHWRPLVGRFLRHRSQIAPFDVAPVARKPGHLLALPFFDPIANRIEVSPLPGSSIAEAVALALPDMLPGQYVRLRVTVGSDLVPFEMWEHVRPKAWDAVLIRVIPGGTELWKSLLLLAVVVAATALGQWYIGPLLANAAAGGLGIFGSGAVTAGAGLTQIVSTLSVAALAAGGTLLVNALIPAASTDAAKQTFAIGGFQNTASQDGPVPQLFGEMRISPPYAALPRTENVGEERCVVVPFLLGHGPLDLSEYEPWIGLTPLSKFAPQPAAEDQTENYQISIREGYVNDDPLEIYNRQVIEEPLSIAVTKEDGPQIRVTAADITSFDVEAFFPSGLFLLNGDGDKVPAFVDVKIEYRLIGTVDWTVIDLRFMANSDRPFWRTRTVTPATRGQYEVQVTRVNADPTETSEVSTFTWSALRSFRPEYPFNFSKPMAFAEIRIRATGKLNGTLDTFSVLARRVCPDWDAGTETWITRTTSNPASIARLILQGPQNTFPDADADLDLPAFQDWHEYCVLKGLTYNAYITEPVTRENALADVCHAGRAFPYRSANKWTIVIDRPRDQFYDYITPRNSWGLQESDPPVTFPDAYAVNFIDASNKYTPARRVIPWPGFPEEDTPIIVDDLALPGKTDPAEVWREARRWQYGAIYRRRSWTVNQDIEQLAIGRGDAGMLAHPVIDRRHMGGRVRLVSGNQVEIDELITMDGADSYLCTFRGGDGAAFERTIQTVEGSSRLLVLTGVGGTPAVDDLTMIYTVAEPAREVIVKLIERTENHGGQLKLVDHAPEIDTLTDAEVAPAWDGRVGEIIDFVAPAPAVPHFVDYVTDPVTDDVTIFVGAGIGTPPSSFTIAHRLQGVGLFVAVAIAASEAALVLTMYSSGQTIELKVLASGANGADSAYSDVVTYLVGDEFIVGRLMENDVFRLLENGVVRILENT